MKSTAIITSLLASAALAQARSHGHSHLHRRHAHGHHDKRGLVTDWVTQTVYETVTVFIDENTTETIRPSSKHVPVQPSSSPSTLTTSTTASPLPGQFFENSETSSATSTSTSSRSVTPLYMSPLICSRTVG